MSNQLATRLRKIEAKLKSERGWVVFHVRNAHREEDFERQHKEYLANGGDPDVSFISLIKYREETESVK